MNLSVPSRGDYRVKQKPECVRGTNSLDLFSALRYDMTHSSMFAFLLLIMKQHLLNAFPFLIILIDNHMYCVRSFQLRLEPNWPVCT